MKRLAISLFSLLAFVFLATPSLQAQSKEIEFQTKYKKGEIFEYQMKMDSKNEFEGGNIPSQKQSMDMTFTLTVVRSWGPEALLRFEFKSMTVQGQKITWAKMLKKAKDRASRQMVRNINRLEIVAGPGLLVRQIRGLSRIFAPPVQKAFESKILARAFLGIIDVLFDQMNSKMDSQIRAHFGALVKGKKKLGYTRKTRENELMAKTYYSFRLHKISRDKSKIKIGHYKMKINSYPAPVARWLGSGTSRGHGLYAVDEKGKLREVLIEVREKSSPLNLKIMKLLEPSLPEKVKVKAKIHLKLLSHTPPAGTKKNGK